ncbi:DUF2339 domain-containing protein [uncultured Phycicoccus sp.]|uniref:DUF2339 domain-containing protein n=1 Tax=uncultured Phycicoccus sp. TaxID=661422 RepID=UPI0026035DA9|nr:DUF2339 domain-containing protein [uncultured Phycicoccus sp.]
MTHRDDVLRLEQEFADAMQRMYTVGNGLARLRADLEQQDARRQAAPAAPLPPMTATPPPVSQAGAAAPAGAPAAAGPSVPPGPGVPPPLPPTAVLPAPEPWYRREGAVTRVLAIAGAVVTLVGVALLLVLAARQGWFGPEARVAAGAALAVVLAGLGVRGGTRDRADGRPGGTSSVALVATGAAAAYLDVVAVTALYGWVPSGVGLALCVAVAVAGLGLARRWSSELLAVLMVAGAAVLSPVVADGPGWLVSAVLAVLAVVGWWAAGDRPAPRLTIVRTTPVALSLLVGAFVVDGRNGLLALLAVGGVTLLAVLVTSTLTVRRHRRDVTSSVAVLVVAVGLLAVNAAQADPVRTSAHAAVAAALLLAASAGGRAPLGPLPVHLVSTVASVGAFSAVLAVLAGAPSGFVGTGLLLLALGHVAVAGATRSRISLAIGSAVAAVALLGWLDHPAAMLSADLATAHDLPVAFVDSGLAAALLAVLTWAVANVRRVPAALRRATRVGAVALGLVAGATMLVSVGTLTGDRLGDVAVGFTAGHALATVAWMVTAAVLLLHSLEHRSDLALRGGLLLVAVAVAKLFLFDLSALDGIVRSIAFIATGLLLLATGSRYAKAWERTRRNP